MNEPVREDVDVAWDEWLAENKAEYDRMWHPEDKALLERAFRWAHERGEDDYEARLPDYGTDLRGFGDDE